MYANLEHPRFWLGPVVSILVAVFLVIVLFNLLIAVMSEEYEELKDQASSIWAFTQFQLLRVEGQDEPSSEKGLNIHSTRPSRRAFASALAAKLPRLSKSKKPATHRVVVAAAPVPEE